MGERTLVVGKAGVGTTFHGETLDTAPPFDPSDGVTAAFVDYMGMVGVPDGGLTLHSDMQAEGNTNPYDD
ncbi:hypothetical protein JCGZ_22101 [Jatropha curcas]|uniref:Uncharacterized protein n=1 Tax=Jatropha curcas TaxID=180498 RepID=A0A067K3Z6_JATCU|nr:hypothetical protein JCGZ_22101 [Jatropha curcas]